MPKTIEELLELPGVGPKMGFLALLECHGIDAGIGVDTHGAVANHVLPADRLSPSPQQSTAVARQVADEHGRADAYQPRKLAA